MHQRLIYDVGMHRGEDTDFYLKKGFDVVAIEANAELAAGCERRFAAHIAAGRLRILNKAIGPISGTLEFFVNEQLSEWGTADLDWVRRNERRGTRSHAVQVDAVAMQQVLSEFGVPYYMKVDIEGFDIYCLEALQGLAQKPRFVSVESSATSFKDTLRQLTLLAQLGYTKFKVIQQRGVDRQRCPSPPREGNAVDHQFPRGSSGLFGAETPGEWQPLAVVKAQYRRIHRDSRIVGPNHGLLRNVPGAGVQRLLRRLFWQGLGWYDTHATY